MININDLAKILFISNHKYQLLCATILRNNHFRSIFHLNNSFILEDDLQPRQISTVVPQIKIVTSFYDLIELNVKNELV